MKMQEAPFHSSGARAHRSAAGVAVNRARSSVSLKSHTHTHTHTQQKRQPASQPATDVRTSPQSERVETLTARHRVLRTAVQGGPADPHSHPLVQHNTVSYSTVQQLSGSHLPTWIRNQVSSPRPLLPSNKDSTIPQRTIMSPPTATDNVPASQPAAKEVQKGAPKFKFPKVSVLRHLSRTKAATPF